MRTPRSDEQTRLAALRALPFLHRSQDGMFDSLTALAGRLLEAPVAFVSLVGDTEQRLRSRVGIDVESTPRSVSFCTHAIAKDDLTTPMVVPDATQDPLFAANPLVTGDPHIRMYAGMPLLTDQGDALGVLCVIDYHARTPTPGHLEALTVLGRNAVTLIEARRDALALRQLQWRNRLITEASLDAMMTLGHDGTIESWNDMADLFFELSLMRPVDRRFERLMSPTNGAGLTPTAAALLHDGTLGRRQLELPMRRADGTDFVAEISVGSVADDNGFLHTVYLRDLTARRAIEAQRHESETRDVAIFALARLAESRDPETGAHLERVQTYCRLLAEQIGRAGAYADRVDAEFVDLIYRTSPLHDIGKVGIPDHVLLKPGKLTPAEFEVMKRHTSIGSDTLEAAAERFPNARFLHMARSIAATHHEKFDGTGYPKGLAGEEIPLCGRIVALADVYDALTSRRVYKDAMSHEQARAILLAECGRHFDPVVVDAFRAVEQQFRRIREQSDLPDATLPPSLSLAA